MSLRDRLSLKPSWLPDDMRVANRVLIHLPVFLIAPGGDPFSATVIDIATHGFRVESGYPAKLGQLLTIDVPAFARYPGWVAWARGEEFGFDVAHQLPERVVDHICDIASQD